MIRKPIIFALSLFPLLGFAEIPLGGTEHIETIVALSRSDNIPLESIEGADDAYYEGYIQALVDMHYYEYSVTVVVKDHIVWLANLPHNALFAKSIISFVKDVPGVKEVRTLDLQDVPSEIEGREKLVTRPQVKGIWFPQATELFQPLVASPRQVCYSIGYRGGDTVVGTNAIPISMGDDFPIFRWLEVLPWKGDLQIGIEACIWAVFDVDVKGFNPAGGAELINTDYYVGIPLSYAVNKWSFRFRIYHISSHLGDEFLVNHPDYVSNVGIPKAIPVRVNPSFEAVDFYSSYQVTDGLRLYFGPGVVIHSDRSFPMKHLYVEYGGEFRFWGIKMYYHRLYGNFFLGANWRNWQFLKWNIDGTYVLGYEWSKLQNIGRKIRLFLQFHHGFSLEGQFMKERTCYWELMMSYGF